MLNLLQNRARRLDNEDISWNTHIRHRLRDPPTHVLMRTEDSLPQDSFPGLDDSIFKLAAIPWVVLFLWFMWEDVAISSKSRLFDHLRHLLCRL